MSALLLRQVHLPEILASFFSLSCRFLSKWNRNAECVTGSDEINLAGVGWLNNNATLLSNNTRGEPRLLLNSGGFFAMFKSMMKKLILILALLAASPASASCYADYKAKQDNPLRLHYGIIELPDTACTKQAAKAQITQRIAADGWKLLHVLSIFDADQLGERKSSAGQYFLRY